MNSKGTLEFGLLTLRGERQKLCALDTENSPVLCPDEHSVP